jgi:hypothetical protein
MYHPVCALQYSVRRRFRPCHPMADGTSISSFASLEHVLMDIVL